MTHKIRVASIVGARPQFVKAAPLSRAFAHAGLDEILIHTGQHYDVNMSDIFFHEMNLPKAQLHLGVGSGPQGQQTGRMLEGLEKVFLQEKPDWVVVCGDTNSTVAGALAAAKLNIPLAHVEAGLRSYDRRMPEEINRLMTDHLSALLFCPSQTAVENLKKEGIVRGVLVTGDVMVDALHEYLPQAKKREPWMALNVEPGGYFLLTIHRASNTDEPSHLEALLGALAQSPEPVIFPVHPRTRQAAQMILGRNPSATIRMIDPVGYLDMLALIGGAKKVFTDSGGLQKEAYCLEVPCVTLRNETEWVETLQDGWNQVVGSDTQKIQRAFLAPRPSKSPAQVYGTGQAATKIAEVLKTPPR